MSDKINTNFKYIILWGGGWGKTKWSVEHSKLIKNDSMRSTHEQLEILDLLEDRRRLCIQMD